MKKFRKGFTLVELLIVIAVMGSLSAMMMYSSSGVVDSADASKILSNLQTLKMAAMQMYIEEPEVAALQAITFGEATPIGTLAEGVTAGSEQDTRDTVAGKLSAYLGKKADAFTSAGAAKKYGLVGDTNHWYVVYAFDDNDDNAAVKEKLEAKAQEADLYGWESATIPTTEAAYYTTTGNFTHIALKVR